MPLYLSRLILNPRSRQVRREVMEPYEMHRTLMGAFPQFMPEEKLRKSTASEPSGILWRLDAGGHDGRLTVHVQSVVAPDWRRVTDFHPDYCLSPNDAGVEDNPAGPKDVSDHFHFRPGQLLGFRLRANPTIKKKVEGKKNGSRIGLIHETDQLAWLARKSEASGFRILAAAVVREDGPGALSKGVKHSGNGAMNLSLLSARFEGTLAVTDPATFANALRTGFGPGKAFGFGLLSLARAIP